MTSALFCYISKVFSTGRFFPLLSSVTGGMLLLLLLLWGREVSVVGKASPPSTRHHHPSLQSSSSVVGKRTPVTFCSMRARGHRRGFPNFNLLLCRAAVFSPLVKVRHDTACRLSTRHAPRLGNYDVGLFWSRMMICRVLCDDTAVRANANWRADRGRVVSGACMSEKTSFSWTAAGLSISEKSIRTESVFFWSAFTWEAAS